MVEEEFIKKIDAVLKHHFGGDSFKIVDYCEMHKDNPVIRRYMDLIEAKVDEELNLRK